MNSVPRYAAAIIEKKFTADEVKVIDRNWDRFVQMHYSSATDREFINAAKMVLACTKEIGEAK